MLTVALVCPKPGDTQVDGPFGGAIEGPIKVLFRHGVYCKDSDCFSLEKHAGELMDPMFLGNIVKPLLCPGLTMADLTLEMVNVITADVRARRAPA